MSSDNFAALINLKEKLHKWKNITLMLGIFSVLLTMRFISGGGLSEGDIVESDYIANVRIEGIIFENEYRSKILEKIAKDDSIKAVIANIDSPGGGIVGSEILFNELRNISKNKPLVVLMGSVAASGGYMAAVASDYIIAHNGTLTGSIGVLMESPEVTELAKKIGVKLNTFKSSPLKGSPSPFEKPDPLVSKVIQESIKDSYQFFVDLVQERREKKLVKKYKNIAFDGRVFTGRQALKVGLIDKIGSKSDALAYLALNNVDIENLPVRKVELVKKDDKFFHRFFSFLPFLNSFESNNNSSQIMAIMPGQMSL